MVGFHEICEAGFIKDVPSVLNNLSFPLVPSSSIYSLHEQQIVPQGKVGIICFVLSSTFTLQVVMNVN